MNNKKIKKTLLLPKTKFPLKLFKHLEKEKEIRELWKKEKIYKKIIKNNKNNKNKFFFLHSGPTYSNGKIHIGHVLNYLIKDIIIRFWNQQGIYSPFLIGWDFHGLPIEHKVISFKKKNDLRKECNIFAEEQRNLQSEQLEKLGIFTNHDEFYTTSIKEYESEQIKIFGKIFEKNLIYEDFKPVLWSCNHSTSLAENEIEYFDKKDISLYFKIEMFDFFFVEKKNISLIVWTTQPWTIPANNFLSVRKNSYYILFKYQEEYFIIIEKRISFFEKKINSKIKEIKKFFGKEILGKKYFHPFLKNMKCEILDGSDFILEDEGSGIVHIAPPFGIEDFNLSKKQGKKIICPLNSNGVFNEKFLVKKFIGKHYLEVNKEVLFFLEKEKKIFQKDYFFHSYPHDWRDKSPLIYRLTKQWFINLKSSKKQMLKLIKKTKWIPDWTEKKIKSFINLREDWCISRQRKWGVPIPVIYKNNIPIIKKKIINYIAELFRKKGSGCWFEEETLSLIKSKFFSAKEEIFLGKDTMDVWFDSGISHWCIIKKNIKKKLLK